MELNEVVKAIQGDLTGLAELGDDATAEAARRLASAIAPALRLRLLELLATLASELGDQLVDARVDVRLVNGEPHVVVSASPPAPVGGDGDGDGGSARLTLRLPETMKQAVERAADADGLSVNAWLTRATKRALDGTFPSPRAGRRLRGRGTA